MLFKKSKWIKFAPSTMKQLTILKKRRILRLPVSFTHRPLVMALEENHDLKEKIIYKLEKYGRSKDETIN